MTWLQRHRARHYIRNSIWLLPVFGMVLAIAAVRALDRLEESMGWGSGFHPEAARAVLGTLAASMFTFIVFVSSALLVVLQLASSQLTPRVVALVFRDPVTKASLTVFVFTFTFSLAALVRVTTAGPRLTTELAAYSCLGSLGVFLYLIDHVGRALRASGALWSVARVGRGVIESVYPRPYPGPSEESQGPVGAPGGEPTSLIASPVDGVVLAFDLHGLASLARRADCVIELVPQVGDFVAVGDPLFRVSGGATVPARALCQSVAVGRERTVEQDPTFVFRILVDIASKGLSPGINDPTTAVLALDQIHHLLRTVGGRHLDEGWVWDADGRLRLVYRTPDWDDFVRLAVTEIRQFGGESIQVTRRLRAMLENLIQVLPEARASVLRRELELLHRTSQRSFPEPEDQALAEESDSQGVGGRHGRNQDRGGLGTGPNRAAKVATPEA
jgi:uncharacterized membrane protein